MNDTSDQPGAKPAATPEFRAAQRWNIVWVVPLLALLIGGWLVYRNYASKGPVAVLRFETADGVAAGTTELRCRSVRVGLVKRVELAEDLKSVKVAVQMEPSGYALLREGSRFWVVKPRISGTDITGLGTLLTGAYIEMEPGAGEPGRTEFEGLEAPPPTGHNVPGRRLLLESDKAGSLTVGSSVFYRGVDVGRIETRRLDPGGEKVVYEAFIDDKYSHLLRAKSRFWNASGVDITTGATGVKVRAPSLSAMLSGGAAFGVPSGTKDPGGEILTDNVTFTLYEDEEDAEKSVFEPDTEVLLMFEQSVFGLDRGAAVRFRGINVGRVLEVSFGLTDSPSESRIPVKIEVDSRILCRGLHQAGTPGPAMWDQAVAEGLRAALKSESLLVPGLYVDLDCYPSLPPATVEHVGKLPVLPTVTAGFAQLEEKLTTLLDKLDALPIEEMMGRIGKAADEAATTIAAARSSLDEINGTATAVRKLLDDPATRALPADLRKTLDQLQQTVASVGPEGPVQGDLLRTLDELRASLRSIKSLSNSLEEKPSSILFGKDSSGNPIPRAPRSKR
jgi:paraquat-inducible protein B